MNFLHKKKEKLSMFIRKRRRNYEYRKTHNTIKRSF